MGRNQVFWGAILLLVGGLMLAGEFGVRLPNGNSLMSLFWPIFLIGFGVWVLIGVFVRGNVEAESASIDLQGARQARVRVNHGAGEFRLHGGAVGNEFLHGTFAGGLDHKTSVNGDTLEVKMRPTNDFVMLPPFFSRNQLDWDMAFNPAVPTALDFNLGANKSDIDLRDLNITDIKFKSGASDTRMVLPAKGRLNADFEIGAASLVLVVPEGVSIRTHAIMGAGDFHVDRSRFPNNGSPDFETAANAVDIRVKGGAASVKVK